MERHESSQAIDDAAAAWAVRVCAGPLSPDEQTEFDAWLAGDRRRLGAFARARAVIEQVRRAGALGPAVLERTAKSKHAEPLASRRRILAWGLSAAGVAGITSAGWMAYRDRVQNFATSRGEIRLVPLADGSSVTLNTLSRISVAFEATRRVVRLLEGEALFNVVFDPGRPFVIDAGEAVITALGSQFLVSRLVAQPLKVLVRNGEVSVRHKILSHNVVRVGANSQADVTGETALRSRIVRPADVARELSWREGMLAFEDMPLPQAARQFARYSDMHIILDDPRLKDETVTGLFSANDPEGFARAIAGTFAVRLVKDGGDLRLTSKK
jgi:transmembrane sensor